MAVLFDRTVNEGIDESDWDDRLLIKAWDAAIKDAKQEIKKREKMGNVLSNEGKSVTESSKKKWRINDKCAALYSEDGLLYEADILKIDEEKKMCHVKFVGYENEEEVSLFSLLNSAGEKARKKQIKEAEESLALAEGEEESTASEMETDPIPRPKTPTATERAAECLKNGMNSGIEANNLGGDAVDYTNFYGQTSSQIPPALPPPMGLLNTQGLPDDEADAMSAMLMSWYMAGYHTGYYVSLRRNRTNENLPAKP